MKAMFTKLFEHGRIGRLEIDNRIVKAATYGCLSNPDGSVTDRLIRYYEQVAHGGVGLVIVEAASIDKKASGGMPGGLSLADIEHVPGLAALAQAIRDIGVKSALQICHAGRDKFQTTTPAKTPSRIPWSQPNPWEDPGPQSVPEELTIEEIREVIAAFGDAAKRAQTAGFDMVELHGAHGTLITNFLSPATNRRADLYGGTLQSRMRFLVEVVRDVRKKTGPDFPLMVRLSAIDYEPGGVVLEETLEVVKVLEQIGVDAIDVSGGSHVQGIHLASPVIIPAGHHVREAEAIKKTVNIPVIASGSITTPEMAEDILESGKADFIALARPLFADLQWPQKAREGRPEDIRPCIRCNDGCHDRSNFKFRPTLCTVNVDLGREDKLAITPAERIKSVAVVGGGPGGMEAARVCSLRGHNVTLYEKRKLGGALISASSVLGRLGRPGASVPKYRPETSQLINYYITQMKKLKVKVIQEEATVETLKDGKFDAVIVAVGATMGKPDIPGIDKPNVTDVLEVLSGKAKVGQRVHIVGGGLIGVQFGLFLAEQGKEIIFTTRQDDILHGIGNPRPAYEERLARPTITIHTGKRLESVTDKGAVVVDRDGNRQEIPADSVVLASGFLPQTNLKEQLEKETDLEVYAIGDCVSPRMIFDAVHEGYFAARKI